MMRRFKSSRQAQRFFSDYYHINMIFRPRRNNLITISNRNARTDSFAL